MRTGSATVIAAAVLAMVLAVTVGTFVHGALTDVAVQLDAITTNR